MEQQEQLESANSNEEWQAPPPPTGLETPLLKRKSSYLYGAIAAIIIGILMVVVGITKILPGIEGGGGMLIIFGAVLLGLSFIRQPESSIESKSISEIEAIPKIFFAPTEVFRRLRQNPRWVGALIIMTLLASAYNIAFTRRLGAKQIVNFSISKLEQSGFPIPSQALEQSRQQQIEQLTNPTVRSGTVISNFASSFIGYALLAVIYLLIVLAMGGNLNFWQSLSAVIYAAFPVTIIRFVLNFIILFVKDPNDIHPIIGQQTLVQDNLGALVNPADNVILWVILSSIGLLSFYWLWLSAVSLKNTGTRVSGSAAWTSAIIVWVGGLVLGILLAAIFPSFFS